MSSAIVQEPVQVSSRSSPWPCIDPLPQASIWFSLNNYAFNDAIFLAERLFAEGKPFVLLLLLLSILFS
jgi:hypothetical protein